MFRILVHSVEGCKIARAAKYSKSDKIFALSFILFSGERVTNIMGTFERVGLFVAVHGAPNVLENETLRSVIDDESHVRTSSRRISAHPPSTISIHH